MFIIKCSLVNLVINFEEFFCMGYLNLCYLTIAFWVFF